MATTTDVPGKYQVALDGVGFMLDDSDGNPGIVHQSIRTQKEQAGSNDNIGESTVNPEGFWRRSRDGWQHGAGQTYGDRAESDSLRFHDSRKVDVFSTPHQATLVKQLAVAYTLTGTNIYQPLSVGGYVYFLDNVGAAVKYTNAPFAAWTPTSLTGLTNTATSLTAIGSTVFIGTLSGIDTATVGAAPASSYVAAGGSLRVKAAKGRLMAWDANNLYNITAGGALPSALITFPTGSSIVGVFGQANWIYIAVAGTNAPSLIYKTTIKPDGTALDVPTVAGELPEGETLVVGNDGAIFGYLGFLFAHTNRGVRAASIDDSTGNLTFGAVIPSDYGNIGAWAASDRYVYFSYSKDLITRVGRLDLTVDILPNTPAFASDMEPADGNYVTGYAIVSGRLVVFTGRHAYYESTTYETTGWVTSGLLALDLADTKTAVSIDVEAGALDATETIVEELSVDRGASFATVGTWNDEDDTEQAVTGVAASRQFEIRTTLNSDGASTPVLYRHTLKVEPGVSQGNFIVLRLRLFENEIGVGGQRQSRLSPAAALAQLEAWQQTREVITMQEGSTDYEVTVRDIESQIVSPCEAPLDGDWNRFADVRLKVIS